MSGRVVGVGAGLGALSIAATYWYRKKRSEETVSVVSWNLLAGPFTMWEAPYHRNPAGSLKAPGAIETEDQTQARYACAGAKLLKERPHVALLQECEDSFFKAERNKHAKSLLSKYRLLPCFGKSPEGKTTPGTAVLLRRDAVESVQSMPRCVGGTAETGGEEKVCSVVDALVKGKTYSFASCHTTWDGAAAQREHHVNLLESALSGSYVVGGDFNAASESLHQLQTKTWLREAQWVTLDAPSGTFKNMPAGKNETIDHFFVSKDVSVKKADSLQEPSCPYGGGSPAVIVGDSDHVPIRVQFTASTT